MKRTVSVTVLIAALSGAARAQEIPPEVPRVIVNMVYAQYPAEGEHSNPENARGIFNDYYIPAAKAFEAAWKKYDARRAEVKKALDDAAALEKDKKLDEAIAKLLAAITPVERDAKGELPQKRALVEPRDAELPAILAWAKLASAKRDPFAAADIAAALFVRRKVEDRDSEKIMWVMSAKTNVARDASIPEQARVEELVGKLDKIEHAGEELAWGYYFAAEKQLGLVRAHYEDASHGKKGEWVLIDVPASKVADKSYKYGEKNKYTVPYDCVLTNRITSIDPTTGTFHYAEKCKYKEVTERFEINATLAAPPPAWAKFKRAEGDDTDDAVDGPKVSLVAYVEHGGPKWVLSKAQVVDFRFLGRAMTGGIPDLMRSILQSGPGDGE